MLEQLPAKSAARRAHFGFDPFSDSGPGGGYCFVRDDFSFFARYEDRLARRLDWSFIDGRPVRGWQVSSGPLLGERCGGFGLRSRQLADHLAAVDLLFCADSAFWGRIHPRLYPW